MDIREPQNVQNQCKVRAAGRPTVEQFSYFSLDCVNYSNRSQIESPSTSTQDSVQLGTASPFDGRPRNIKHFALIPIVFARLRRSLARIGARRSIAS